MDGMPFRDAYKKVGMDIKAGTFTADPTIRHTHEGSMGHLCNEKIERLMQQTIEGFRFENVDRAEKALLA